MHLRELTSVYSEHLIEEKERENPIMRMTPLVVEGQE